MAAFLPAPAPIPLNVPGARSTSLRPAFRPRPCRPHAARIHVSATTDEVRAPDNLSRTADQNGIPTSPGDVASDKPATPKLNAPPSLAPPPARPSQTPRTRPAARPAGGDNPLPGPDAAAAPGGDAPNAPKADADTVLYTRCGSCTAVYDIDPKVLGRGRKVQCSVCQNTWFQRPDRLLTLDQENEKMLDYPMEQKDDLMRQAAEARRNRPPRGPPRGQRDGPGGDRRGARSYDGNREGGRYGGDRGGGGGGERRGRGGARSGFSVFIGNLPYTVTEVELREAISPVLPDGRLTLMKDQETGRSRGFAFCDCASEQQVDDAVNQLDGIEVGGRTIQVRPGRKNNSR